MKASLFLVLAVSGGLLAQTPPAPSTAKTAPTPSAKPAGAKPAKPADAKAPAAASPASPAPAASGEDKIVMTVGSEKLTAKDFEAFIESIPEQYRAQARGPMKRNMAEQIVRIKLLSAEARRRGLDKQPAVQARIALNTDNLLAGAAFNDILSKTVVDEAALRKYYDEHKNEYETVEARHILIKFKGSPVPAREGQKELTEEEALAKTQEIRKRLLAGEDFSAVAKAESDDTGSGSQGGSLGPGFKRGQMVPAFEQAAFSLPVGQLSEPVKTQFGYHLIQVEKHDVTPFEQVKEELEQKMRPDIARQSVEKLREESNVVLDEAFFGPEKPATAAPAAK